MDRVGWVALFGLVVAVGVACGDDDGVATGTGSSGGSGDTSVTTAPDTGMSTAAAESSSTGAVADSTTVADSTDSTGGSSTGGSSTGGSSDGSSGSGTGGEVEPVEPCATPAVSLACTDPVGANYPGSQHDLDILFIIDNSASMGTPQARIAAAMDSFVARMDNEGVDYRIAVTTTDVGNPWCNGTTPEAGNFVASSCRGRQAEFVFNGATTIDVTTEACLDVCPHDAITIQPTTTAVDDQLVARPWIERIDGTTNLPGGVTPAEALRCFLPMGIGGCGFEQPLEALNRAIARTSDNGENEYGFVRDGADTLVVVVTDEVDCSSDPEFQTIFLPDGNRVFWSDPDAGAPTSAVCWNAGVECVGESPYEGCGNQNYDVDANPGVSDEEAVMHPLSRYADRLDELDAANGAGEVRVALIGGVPSGGNALVYADGTPTDQLDWGIGPACTTGSVSALPPVRVRELFQATNPADQCPLYSICSPSYCDDFEHMINGVLP